VLGQFDTDNPPTISAFLLPAKVVFEAAIPILIVPNASTFGDLGRRPLVAWDGSREAARAIHDAMPLLAAAERVSVLAIDPLRQGHMHGGPQTAKLLTYLSHHGIHAEQKEIAADDKGVTADLLGHATAMGADLLVMGAYGHSRIWEFLIGGATQHLLERTRVPVLMSRCLPQFEGGSRRRITGIRRDRLKFSKLP
jgi:nucleotide-binding universal stress UspA family protein